MIVRHFMVKQIVQLNYYHFYLILLKVQENESSLSPYLNQFSTIISLQPVYLQVFLVNAVHRMQRIHISSVVYDRVIE